jgi:hypothetical protein
MIDKVYIAEEDLGYEVTPYTLEDFRSEMPFDIPAPTTLEDW